MLGLLPLKVYLLTLDSKSLSYFNEETSQAAVKTESLLIQLITSSLRTNYRIYDGLFGSKQE